MTDTIKAVINLDIAGPVISRHIYGHFAEHLGDGIYGGFYVGDDSTIPNDQGIRLDVVEALRQIDIPNLRWPGGCFADEYHWKDGIGPKEDRPSLCEQPTGATSKRTTTSAPTSSCTCVNCSTPSPTSQETSALGQSKR